MRSIAVSTAELRSSTTRISRPVAMRNIRSAVEAAVDRIGHDPHNLSGQAKDLGSAAVFVSLVTAGLVWTAVAADRFVF